MDVWDVRDILEKISLTLLVIGVFLIAVSGVVGLTTVVTGNDLVGAYAVIGAFIGFALLLLALLGSVVFAVISIWFV